MRIALILLLLSAAGVLVQGYHLGTEDQAIYLPGIKKVLDPGLYPYDSAMFLAQTAPTQFDELIAGTVRWLGMPLEWALLTWHFATVFLFLLACCLISRRLFSDPVAQWAAVVLATLTLGVPVAGTLLRITAEYLHPRNIATVALLFGLLAVLDRKPIALAWVAVAAVVHPQMALFGAFHLAVLAIPLRSGATMFSIPFFQPGGEAWREVMGTRMYHFPLRWKWYEQMGAVAPLLLLGLFAHIGRRTGSEKLAWVCSRIALSGSLGVAGAVAITLVPDFEPLIRIQSMRTLHLVHVVLFLIGGGLLGQYVLRNRLRWVLFFVPLAALMGYTQGQLYPSSPQIEWPGARPQTEWLRAFDWIRQNTPRNAMFALDPRYLERPSQDNHGFRALAERSMMADYTKDRGVAALFPELADTWRDQVEAREDWQKFSAPDFRRLRARFGVDWVVLERPGVQGLPCPYANSAVMVCRVDQPPPPFRGKPARPMRIKSPGHRAGGGSVVAGETVAPSSLVTRAGP